ncbi:MAG: DEAD/DEAH box helicase family protein [Lachnospiraceae bacterium]|nr:DEAD/DEAH box helicase family protein [Lachnospiraceae bacterium]
MGAAYERAESAGGGSDPDGVGIRLSPPVTEFEQLSLFQAGKREAAEDEQPAAFSLPEDDLDNDLLRGSQFEGGKMRIYALYQHESNAAERAKFLQKEYGLGGHSQQLMSGESGFVDYSGKGVLIHSFRSGFEVRYTWREAEKRIKRLIDAGIYLNDKDKTRWEALEEKYAAVGGVPYPDPAYRMPEPEEILAEREGTTDVKPEEEQWDDTPEQPEETDAVTDRQDDLTEDIEHLSGEVIEDYQVGDVITLEGTEYIIDEVREHEISMRDPRLLYPLFRVESRENLKALLEQEADGIKPVVSPEESLAQALDAFSFDHDYYNYQDYVNDRESHIREIAETLEREGDAGYRVFLTDFIEETEDAGARAEAIALLDRLDALLSPEHEEEKVVLKDVVIDLTPRDEESEEAPVTEAAEVPAGHLSARNYRITDMAIGEGGPKEKYRRNVEAIRTLKMLEAEGRPATEEEQEILAQYVGWGGIQDAFDDKKDAWSAEYHELRELLTEEEYKAARATVLNAHYTSPTVIRAIYDAVGQMGFQQGNILEPSMGIGNFFGMLPEEMQGSCLYGVELDSITGRIAQHLYPEAEIKVAGFETTDRRDFYDLAIGNVPFGTYKVNDKAYNKLGFNIHNYFFAKALDQVRPGGVIAFVTSRYTMDSVSPEVRKYLAERAELLGAIRLPNDTFKANAGTEVVSDILFLQKREHPVVIEPEWVGRGITEEGFELNSYFVEHPEMVLGTLASESTQYGREELTVLPKEGADLSELLAEAVKNIRGEYREAEVATEEIAQTRESIPADPDVKNFSYTIVDGEVYFRENARMYPVERPETELARIKGMIAIRQTVNDLINYQMEDYPDEEIAAKQEELNAVYDDFVAKHGLINQRTNERAFSEDSSYYLLCSLENIDEDGNLKGKADMFTKRTIRPERAVTSVDTPSEALAVSIGERGKVDLPFMAELLGTPGEYDIITKELQGVIFKNPEAEGGETDGWQTADEYLSGNVRKKLAVAEKAAEQDARFAVNRDALEKVQPKDLDASEIDVQLGATWIDKSYIQKFMHETFDTPFYLTRTINVEYSPVTAAWRINGKTKGSRSNVEVYVTYGTDRANAFQILEETLNLKDMRIYDTIEDAEGNKKRVLNKKETTLAVQKQQAIRDAFRDWIWKDPDRRQAIVKKYNELFNSTRPREYDGSHIRFVGMNPDIELRPHQINAIAHVLYGQNTLLAHEVGAGKTFEMAAAAMEAKRLGLCQKSLFVVPNHLTEQWASDFMRLYPSAKILVARKKDFETKNRKKFCARIATGDYDAVIIGHSQFEKIPVSFERQQKMLEDQIEEIQEAIAELKFARGERFTIKQMEATRKTLETRLAKLMATERKDDVINFEQLGVDRLFVDESHFYKNLFLYTKMRNVAGLSTSEAQKSSDMFLKTQYMDEITGGRGTVFATGTPVSNSMTEMYTVMRYLQYATLKEKQLAHFDCWASTFGQTTTSIELAVVL